MLSIRRRCQDSVTLSVFGIIIGRVSICRVGTKSINLGFEFPKWVNIVKTEDVLLNDTGHVITPGKTNEVSDALPTFLDDLPTT